MTSRLVSLPCCVDRMVFDGLQFDNLVNTILEYPRYRTREKRIETRLDTYIREKFIRDFIGEKLYQLIIIEFDQKSNPEIEIKNALRIYGPSNHNYYNLNFYCQLLGLIINSTKNEVFTIDPFLLYMLMTKFVNPISHTKILRVDDIGFDTGLHCLLHILNLYNGTVFNLDLFDIENMVVALEDCDETTTPNIVSLLKDSDFVLNIKNTPTVIYSIVKYLINASDPYMEELAILLKDLSTPGNYASSSDHEFMIEIVGNIFKNILTDKDIVNLLTQFSI